MILQAVFIFGIINICFEWVLLSMLSPRLRLRILGSSPACTALHFLVFGLNLWIHFGTLIGTTGAVLSFCASLITIAAARAIYGRIEGSTYHTGLLRYGAKELA